MVERLVQHSRTPALTLWIASLTWVVSACASGPEPVTVPAPEGSILEEPAPDAMIGETGVDDVGVEPLPEDPVEPDPVGTAFEGPSDEEIDLALHRLLGPDPIGLVQEPDDAAPRLPLEMNDRVGAWINYFQNVIHDRFALYLERKGEFEPMIRRKLHERGMPQDLIYLSLIESGMNPNAYSRASAVGLWQFIRGTARLYDLEVSFWVDERRNPEKATDASLRHLSDLYERFGSWYLAAAAYNGGPGRISRGLRRTGGGTFWDLADARVLRSETRNYVPKLIAAAIIGHDPKRYGFDDLDPRRPIAHDVVIVPDATSFDVLAEAAGTDEETIRDLNPQFPQRVTPPGREVEFNVPSGSASAFEQRYAQIPVEERVSWTFHVVKRGQTLGGIGANYGVSVAALRAANGNINPRRLRIGQRLVIPKPARTAPPSARSAPATPKPATSSTRRAEGPLTIVVREGDSLWRIARRYSVSTQDLMRWNGLRTTVIRPGDRLEVRR